MGSFCTPVGLSWLHKPTDKLARYESFKCQQVALRHCSWDECLRKGDEERRREVFDFYTLTSWPKATLELAHWNGRPVRYILNDEESLTSHSLHTFAPFLFCKAFYYCCQGWRLWHHLLHWLVDLCHKMDDFVKVIETFVQQHVTLRLLFTANIKYQLMWRIVT